MNQAFQRERSVAEKALPQYQLDAMDRARACIDPMTNANITPEQAAIYVNSWLPLDDPGRMFTASPSATHVGQQPRIR